MVDADEEGYLLQNLYKTSTRQTYFILNHSKEWEPKALVQVILKLCLSL
jgi:hypothetical protein